MTRLSGWIIGKHLVEKCDNHHETGRHRIDTHVAGKLDPKQLITHHFKLGRILQLYDTFAKAATTKALKLIIEV